MLRKKIYQKPFLITDFIEKNFKNLWKEKLKI